ncbi:MAG: YqgE/AlgH family protein [Desulfobacteraceae bacterium]
MSDTDTGFLKGQLLMAMPGLPDPNFAQTVTCMCEHNEAGALGFIVNRIHPLLTGRELFDDLKIQYTSQIDQMNIHLGGPVQPSGVFVLHGPPFDWHACMKVTDEIGLSNTRDILEAIAGGEGPDSFLILLGCAGWGPRQLDTELSDNAWLHCPISTEILFNTKTDQIWEQTMMMIGFNTDNFSDSPGSA